MKKEDLLPNHFYAFPGESDKNYVVFTSSKKEYTSECHYIVYPNSTLNGKCASFHSETRDTWRHATDSEIILLIDIYPQLRVFYSPEEQEQYFNNNLI